MADKTQPHGDKHATDDIIRPYLQMGVAAALKHFADFKPVDAFLRGLSPVEKMGIKAAPGVVAAMLRKMPNSWLKNPEWAELFKDSIVDGFKEVAEIVTHKGAATPEEIEKAFKDAETAVLERKFKVDALGHVHMLDCARLAVSAKPQQQNQRNQNKRNQPEPEPQPQSNPGEITLKAAIAQGLKASPCCFHLVEEAKAQATAAPKSAKKNRSPLEIIGSIKDEELKKAFKAWLNDLSKEDRVRALEALRELDSEEEFHGFMAMDPAVRIEFLPLLENRNASYAVRKYLGIAGALLKNGWKTAAAHYAKWNESLAPEVARLQRKYHDEQGNVIPHKKPSWGRTLKGIFSLNPFQ